MDEQVFADGIGTISMIGGTVRVDLMTYSPTELDAAGQPRPVFRQRIIMGLDAFLSAAEKLQEAAKALSARTARPEPAPAPAPVTTFVSPEPVASLTAVPEQRTPAPPVKPPFP